jgi:hypothetical protein
MVALHVRNNMISPAVSTALNDRELLWDLQTDVSPVANSGQF